MNTDGSGLRAALYLRVSTGEQTVANQLQELEAVAAQRGWQVVEVYDDAGLSGGTSRQGRPGLDAMLRDAVRGRFDVVACWSVDRLGRSLQDLVTTLGDLQSARVGLYLHRQAVDTTTPSGRAMFQMLGVFAEFERAMIQERVRAGLQRARAEGKRLGRPKASVDAPAIRAAVRDGLSIRQAAERYRTSRSTVHRLVQSA